MNKNVRLSFFRHRLDSGQPASKLLEPPLRRQIEPYLPAFSAYPEPMSLNGGFGFALWIVPPILGIIIVHPVVTQNRRYENGEETQSQQSPSRA